MFIREDIKRIKGKRYRYLRLVETYRTPGGPRQRTLLSLGCLRIPRNRYRELVELIEDALYGQRSIFHQDGDNRLLKIAERSAEKIKRKGRFKILKEEREEKVHLSPEKIKAGEAREFGPVYVGYEMIKRLGMDRIFSQCGLSPRYRDLAVAMVLSRLIHPTSENGCIRWMKRTAISELLQRDLGGLKKDTLYRVSDKLIENKDKIETLLRDEERRLFGLKEHIVLYDLTSTYFEGFMAESRKAMRGYSRDKRSDAKQVVVGLILDEDGFSKGHEVYEGNRLDCKGIKEFISILKKRYTSMTSSPTVVIDRGVATEENLRVIKEEGYHYIAVERRKGREGWLKEFEGEEFQSIWTQSGHELKVAMKERGEEFYLLCFSEARARKEEAIFKREKDGMMKSFERLKRRIERGRIKDIRKIASFLGRIKKMYPKVARFFKIELNEGEDKRVEFSYEFDKEREKQMEELYGTYLLRTNRKDLSPEELWRLYIMLTKVERAFRALKSDIRIRPIYHHKDKRIEGHIFLSLLAYHVLHTIEWTLRKKGDSRSWESIKEILIPHQMVTVIIPDDKGRVHHLRLLTEASIDEEEIYERLNLNARPFKTRHIVVGEM